LDADRNKTVSVTGKAKAMAGGFEANPSVFNNSNPTPVALLAQVTVVDKAETVAATRAKGAAAARDVERGTLFGMLETGCLYIQGIADTRPTYAEAVKVILAGGLTVSTTPQHSKPLLKAELLLPSAIVQLIANASLLVGNTRQRPTFNWCVSSDGKTYNNLPSTPHANTEVPNLGPGTYNFKVSVTLGKTVGAWSDPVPLVIH
jgi:hypothetical protein